MNPHRSTGALLAAVAIAVATVAVVPAGALANGVGDLYASTDNGVLELHAATATTVNRVTLASTPTALAFSPNGRSLYAVLGTRSLAEIDIETISLAGTISLPAAGVAAAFPKGTTVVVAMPSRKALALVDTSENSVAESPKLPGAVDLVAADRRESWVIAAESGASWIATYNPATDALVQGTVTGSIVALSVDRDRGAALVATSGPNQLVRVRLSDLGVEWTADLPAAPVGVAALGDQILAAGGKKLWVVDETGARAVATLAGTVVDLAASDEGSVVYAAEKGAIEAFSGLGVRIATIPASVTDLVDLAPVPHASSVANGDGGPSGPQTGDASGAPQTDTINDLVRSLPVDVTRPLPGAALVSIILLAGGLVILRRTESSRRG